MLKTNLFAKVTDDKVMANIAIAIKAEGNKMMVSVLEEKVTSLEKRIENKNGTATVEMIEGYKSELAEVTKNIEALEAKIAEVATITAEVEEVIDAKLLRILACAENSKYEKYAISWSDEEAEALYNAMCNIHDFDGDKLNTANFKRSTDILEKVVRLALSFAETEYTEKVNVRLNKNDLRLINETWTTGAKNKYHKDNKNDTVEYKATEARFIVSKKQKKGEDAVYNWSKFNAILVKIAIAKIANI